MNILFKLRGSVVIMSNVTGLEKDIGFNFFMGFCFFLIKYYVSF